MSDAQVFKRVLIANRGEIAIRIAQAAAALGIESVAVYAKADANALHSQYADKAVELPGDAPLAAYLDIEALIAIAKENSCDCLHPGYGFLSESAEFSKRCETAGIAFIGPKAETLSLFGDKMQARELAVSAGVSVIPATSDPVNAAADVEAFIDQHDLPVMLKALAGGGGRGMRAIHARDEISESLQRCQGEAESAFGNGAVFVEKLVEQPRHIEVQILADNNGNVLHFFDRDCSVQLRHQKVVEVAPAANIDAKMREQMLNDAVKISRAANLRNACTVEFLYQPESGEYYFIECNPRIQVEHTITETVMGVDLLQSQFRIAAGETLADLGWQQQSDIGTPRGIAIQCRVVAQGAGTLNAYREPGGSGVRTDGCGYIGYTPAPHYDPLLAKLIAHIPSSDMARAAQFAVKALDEFHIDGLPTNINLLRAILNHHEFTSANARTGLIDSLDASTTSQSALQQFLGKQAGDLGGRAKPLVAVIDGLKPAKDELGIEAPMGGSVIQIEAKLGDRIEKGDTLLVISAMKMEATLVAPCSGQLTQLMDLQLNQQVAAGQLLACIEAEGEINNNFDEPAPWQFMLDQKQRLQSMAHARFAPGSNDPGVVRQRQRGKLTCRERIDLLLDEGSFREIGSLTGFSSFDEDGNIIDFTPANHVGGTGAINQRQVVVCADDFTSRGGHSDGAVIEKSPYMDRLSLEHRIPSIRLLDGSSGGGSVAHMVPEKKAAKEKGAQESSAAIKAGQPRVAGSGGSLMPPHLFGTTYAEQLATVPVVNLLLGSVVGIGAVRAVLGHFSVMVADISQLFVAGPPVVSHAMGYDVTKEELGGWHIHATNGSVDNLAATEQEAVAMSQRFLSYLPSSVYELPPHHPCNDPLERIKEELAHIIPRQRTATFNVRRVIELMADQESFFEIGTHWGTDQITGLARFGGYAVGVIASDNRHLNGGALTADGCAKLKRHIDLCDLFHLPIVNLVDTPGFAVGIEHETAGTLRRGAEWTIAFAQSRVPIFTVVMRRAFGVAGANYATPRATPCKRVTWPAADVGGIPPEGGIEAAYKRQLQEADDPEALRAELMERIESVRGPIGPLNKFQLEEMQDPRHTRQAIGEWVEQAYRLLAHPDQLGPRGLQYRP